MLSLPADPFCHFLPVQCQKGLENLFFGNAVTGIMPMQSFFERSQNCKSHGGFGSLHETNLLVLGQSDIRGQKAYVGNLKIKVALISLIRSFYINEFPS